MIYDSIENAWRYEGINSGIRLALDFMFQNRKATSLLDGTYELDPGKVRAYVVSKRLIYVEESNMEIHRKFIDIHYILKGAEWCGFCSPLKGTDKYNGEQDIEFQNVPDTNSLYISEGNFYLVWPGEPHRPLISGDGKLSSVRKIICKVPVEGITYESN